MHETTAMPNAAEAISILLTGATLRSEAASLDGEPLVVTLAQ